MAAPALHPLVRQALVINLAARPDRWAQVVADWAGTGVALSRRDAVADAAQPALGCMLSHIAALEELAAAPSRDAVLVLEDDAVPTPDWHAHAAPVLDAALALPPTVPWRLLNLGPNLRVLGSQPLAPLPESPLLLWTPAAFTTHAVLYHRRALALLPALRAAASVAAATGRPPTPIDVLLCKAGAERSRMLVPHRALVTQRPGYSDIERRAVNYGVIVDEFNARAAAALARP
jgi:hypothetical protein